MNGKCDRCKSNQSVYYFKCFIGSKAIEQSLCTECADELGIPGTKIIGSSLEELVFESPVPAVGDGEGPSILDLTCDCCGTNLKDVGESGMLGCEQCYVIFSDALSMGDAYLSRMDGEIPSEECEIDSAIAEVFPDEIVMTGKRNILEQRMGEAIANENYEEAAKIRDEINAEKGGQQDD